MLFSSAGSAQVGGDDDLPAYSYGTVSLPRQVKEESGPKLARRFGKLNQVKSRENDVKDAIVNVQPRLLRICAEINGLQRQLFAVRNPHDESRPQPDMPPRVTVKDSKSTVSSQSRFILSEEDKSKQYYHDQAAYDKKNMDFEIIIGVRKVFDAQLAQDKREKRYNDHLLLA